MALRAIRFLRRINFPELFTAIRPPMVPERSLKSSFGVVFMVGCFRWFEKPGIGLLCCCCMGVFFFCQDAFVRLLRCLW